MSNHETERITTRIKSGNDLSRTIIFPLATYCQLNEALVRDEGTSLFDLTDHDPSAAYSYLRAAVATAASRDTVDVSMDGRLLADTQTSGEDTTHTIAQNVVYGILPEPYEGARTVYVAIAPSMEDELIGLDEPMTVLELNVTPPDLVA